MSVAPPLPQVAFDDVYSTVYAILDDAKKDRCLVKLYKGSHAALDPHQSVLDFGSFFLRERRGLFAFCHSLNEPAGRRTARDLATFDARFRPRIPLAAVFENLSAHSRRPTEPTDDFLDYIIQRQHQLGQYRGGSSGLDDEARAFAATHFQGLGFSASVDDVQVFCGGFKGVFIAFCASLMCVRTYDEICSHGGQVLVPVGYYQSLRLIPAMFGGELVVVPDMTSELVEQWLSGGDSARAIYVPLVNNASGRILSRERAHSIASVVLRHNRAQPENPVYVLGDDVYVGSYLAQSISPRCIGAVTGTDLGDDSLGTMEDWTVTVVTPSKTFALPTSRVAFALTANRRLHQALAHYRTALSLGRVPQIDELCAVAALSLTPQSWIDHWNVHYRNRVNALDKTLAEINSTLGFEAFQIERPEGGWYVALRVSRKLLPAPVASNVDAFAVFLHYGEEQPDTGIALLPGELFGYGFPIGDRDGSFILLCNIAVVRASFDQFLTRLARLAETLRGPSAQQVVDYALRRARAIADVDAILLHRRY